ncbi:hypothetical protein WKY82_09295 [Gordonia malaquae]|uniref:Gp37-like protein n=1 Tax=Gordonia malaquae TaxID=410332 RepID=UPI0030C78F6A
MTAPVLTLEEQCEAIWAATEAEDRRIQRMNETPPGIFIFDGHQRLQHLLLEVVKLHVEDPENDTGPVELTIPFDHPVAQWMHDDRGRMARGEGENFHIDVEKNGVRVSARYESKEVIKDEKGQRLLVVTFLTDYENLKWIDCWSNPFLPAIFQFPRIFLLAGPAIWVLKTALFVNLWRIYSSIWQIPDDPMNPVKWLDGLDMSTWDIVVAPTTFAQDMAAGTTWAMFVSRWGKWHDRAEMILRDAELSVVTRRYRHGDPEPWPGADLKDGALVIDIVDKSGHMEGAANGGSIFDGLTRTLRQIVGDMVEDVETELAADWPSAATMFEPRKGVPAVHFPADWGVETHFKTTPSKGLIMNTGGHSMPGVNEAISAGIQAGFDIVGTLLHVGAIGGSVDALLKPFYTDTVLAWISVKLPHRKQQAGSSGYLEYHIDLPGQAYTLSSLLAIRSAVVATSRTKSASIKFSASGPYAIGWKGSGHMYKGDRASFEVEGSTLREIHVERMSKATLDWEAHHFAQWEAEFGPKADEDAVDMAIRKIRELASAASELGVF